MCAGEGRGLSWRLISVVFFSFGWLSFLTIFMS